MGRQLLLQGDLFVQISQEGVVYADPYGLLALS